MRVKIISDSTCDLSAELIKEHNIGIVPLIVMKDGQVIEQGTHESLLSREDSFYRKLYTS